MPANLSKRSVVKHRTNKPFHSVHGKKAGRGGEGGTGANSTSLGASSASKGKGRSGFQVGPKHAPDGAYLGRAKKIKADLIEKAKIKKRFFKSIKGNETQSRGQTEADPAAILDRDEGKFAPERTYDEEVDEGSNILYQMRNREEAASQKEEKKGKGRDERRSQQAQHAKAPPKTGSRLQEAAKEEVTMSKEDRNRLRADKTERWHSQSGSQRGRERGQPNLGARMDLLLERIKQQS